MGVGRGDGHEPGDMRLGSPMQAQSQRLLTHMAKGRVTDILEGERGKYLVLGPKKRRHFQQWCVYVHGVGGKSTIWVPATQRGISWATLPSHAAGSPVPSLNCCSHPGFVQETWVKSSPRADGLLLWAAHRGTRLLQRVDSARCPARSWGCPMAPAGNLIRVWRCAACREGRSFDELRRGKNF